MIGCRSGLPAAADQGTPQRPQRCKFFADGQFTDLGRRLDGEARFLEPVDIGLRLKKILQRLSFFGTKMFYFRDYFLNTI